MDFVAFRVAASYQNAGRWEQAIRAYRLLIDTYPTSVLVARAKNNIAQCHVLAGDSAQGLAALEQFLETHKGSNFAPRVQFTLGMLHVDKRDWTQAGDVWNALALAYPESPFAAVSDRLVQRIENMDTLPRRAPTVAGVLSTLVPGSGQVYSGRGADGFYTFMSLVVLGGAGYYYAEQDRLEVAVPIGILGVFFYGSSIYQSIQAARVFNLRQESRFRDQLQQEIRDSGLFGPTAPQKVRSD